MFAPRTSRFTSEDGCETNPLHHSATEKDLAEPFLRYHEPVDWQENPLARREYSPGPRRKAGGEGKHVRGNSLFEADWSSVSDLA
jgi:hypothetical protein